MEGFTTVTHTLFFMEKRIPDQMFVYLGTSLLFFEGGGGGLGQYQNIFHPAETVEKISYKRSHWEKSNKGFLLSRLKNILAQVIAHKILIHNLTSQKIAYLLPVKCTIQNLFRAQFTCQPAFGSSLSYIEWEVQAMCCTMSCFGCLVTSHNFLFDIYKLN